MKSAETEPPWTRGKSFHKVNSSDLQAALGGASGAISLGGFRFFKSIGSTNDEARAWLDEGASDLSLVIADEQTAGRGRSGRKWFTPPGTALAFSLILRPNADEQMHPARITGLGAVALTESLQRRGLAAKIKWPNDVLINRRKAAGILVESIWNGDQLEAFILGIGVNVLAASVPPADQLFFPATSLESELNRRVDRIELLKEILSALIQWRSKIGTAEFIKTWEHHLAFRGESVQVRKDNEPPLTGTLLGLESDGGLRLASNDKILAIQLGEIHLRPADDKIK